MKRLFICLIAIPLLAALGCSKGEIVPEEETVQMNFCAKVPQQVGTRASSGLVADVVYCAVYENGTEHTNLRTEIPIVDGQDIIFSPRLIKSRTYKVVFWACKEGAYNVDDMENIQRVAPTPQNSLTEADYDAFSFATNEFTVGANNTTQNVTLLRPFAQLNMGVPQSEWDAVASPLTFGMTPTKIKITIDDAREAYDAFAQQPVGGVSSPATPVEYELVCSGENFTCTIDNTDKTFKSLAMCYVLKGTTNVPNIKYTVYDEDDNPIVSDIQIEYVSIAKNYKTHVVGSLLTGSVSYRISIEDQLDTDPNYNDEI